HFVHALAAGDAFEWSRAVLADDSVDKASRDERLVRCVTDDELATVLACYWSDETGARACDDLFERVERLGVEVSSGDDDDEDDTFPLLVDAGWELARLADLDPDRHRGAIEALDDWEIAKFEEEEYEPRPVHLQELPAIGVAELLRGLEPFSIWL